MKKYKFPKYPDNWKEISKACLRRDNYKCVRCKCGSTPGNRLHAHHIISKSKNGMDNLNNLKILCRNCHELKHPHMRNMKKRSVKTNGRKKENKKIIFFTKRVPKVFSKKT